MLVSYIVSIIFSFGWLYRNKLFKLKEIFSDSYRDDEEFLLEIYIPRIKLREVVYNIDSSLNKVDYHVEILNNSNLENNLFFLAAHSGSGRASYFDNLVFLEKGDIVWLSSDIDYAFVVVDKFYIQKDGYFEANYDSKGDTLFLITCSLRYVDKQLIVRAKLIYKC